MQLKDYFDFLAPDDIRIKGTRIGIESILMEYLHDARTPEDIAERFHSVTLEQVYAAILYYLHNQVAVSAYLNDYLEYVRQTREAAAQNSAPGRERLLRIKEHLGGLCGDERDTALRQILAEEKAQKTDPTRTAAA